MVYELWLCTLSVERRLESERSQLATLMHPFTLRERLTIIVFPLMRLESPSTGEQAMLELTSAHVAERQEDLG